MAFQELCHQLLSESENQLKEWKASIARALAHNGKEITDILPDVKLIVGKQPGSI